MRRATTKTHGQLLALGGENQIPFLVEYQRGMTMYESEDIVDYLGQLYE